MKSLEFINKDLQDFEKALENYKKRKAINNEEVDEEYIKQMTKEIENYKQTKQDLEALEIIRKKVDFRFMGTCLQVSGENNTKWTFIKEFNLSKEKEEYSKFKNWLETNKEGDSND